MYRTVIALLLSAVSAAASAYSVTLSQVVDSHDNLYYTDWGHWYTQASDNALNNPDSFAARSVAYNFAGFDTVSISAWGDVVDEGTTATGPDGCAPSCGFNDGNFRMLPVYSLIGIWSSSPTEIDPFGDWKDTSSGLGLLEIGSSKVLSVPDFGTPAYLFLAENDGIFGDNSGHYDVRLTASVPEPGPLGLVAAGILGLVIARRRMK